MTREQKRWVEREIKSEEQGRKEGEKKTGIKAEGLGVGWVPCDGRETEIGTKRRRKENQPWAAGQGKTDREQDQGIMGQRAGQGGTVKNSGTGSGMETHRLKVRGRMENREQNRD